MRLVTLILVMVIALLQWPLWLGKGSWLGVWGLEKQIEAQRAENAKLSARNDSLLAEVADLKTGTDAIEERARAELGMIKSNEIFFQVLKPGAIPLPAIAASSTVPAYLPASSAIASPIR